MNLNDLFNQFIGSQTINPSTQNQTGGTNSVAGMVPGGLADKLPNNIPGGLVGGLAAGGLLGVLVGNKKIRKKAGKMAGGAVGLGGAAILGAVAYNAYQKWQSGKPQAGGGTPTANTPPLLDPPSEASFQPDAHPASDGQPFQIALIKAMIAAANADGHIDGDEQQAIFDAVEKLSLQADEKALIFDTLRKPPTLQTIAGYANGLEQASELYVASLLAIDPDHPAEHRYLDDLSEALGLPPEFVEHLEQQVG